MAADRDVPVGILHSLTGFMSISEQPLVQAALMAIDEINEAGGVFGRRIRAVVEDGASESQKFAASARKLLQQDRVAALFGCWTSACRKAVKSVVEENGALLWYPVQYEGLEESPNVVYTGSCLNQQIEPAVRWLMARGYRRCLLVGSDYVFPRTANRLIASMWRSGGGEIVADCYVPLGCADFSALATQIAALQPDVLFNTLNGESNFAFFRQLHDAGLRSSAIPIMSFSIAEQEQAAIADVAAGHYACWSYFESLPTPENIEFVRRFQTRCGEGRHTSDPVMTAYSQLFLWKQAVENARSFDPAVVRGAVVGCRYAGPGGVMEIRPNHHIRRRALIGRSLENGEFEVVWQSDGQIEPKPWLGAEDLDLARGELIKEALKQFPQTVFYASQLEREIAGRKESERALKRSSERLNLAQSAAHIGIWDWNIQTQQAWVNEEYHGICDLPPDATPSYESFLEQVVPEDRAKYDSVLQDALAGRGQIDTECRIVGGRDGKTRWIRSTGKVFFGADGQPQRAMGALLDITAFKEAEQAQLEKSEDRYRRIVETSLEGIWLIDQNAKTSFVNSKMAEMLGYAPEEMLGRDLTHFMDEEWAALALKKLLDPAAGVVEACDFKFRRKDGSDLWGVLSRRPVFEKEAYIGALVMVMDFTERKRLQDQIRKQMHILEEADRRKNEFLATLAHELRNPLAPIRNAVAILQRQKEGPDTESENVLVLKMAERQVNHLTRLVDDLLEVARISQGKIQLKTEKIDLADVVAQAGELSRGRVRAGRHQLSLDIPLEPLPIEGDPTRLAQVFANLIDNAARYTEPGGHIYLVIERKGGEAIVRVRDNGIGIPKEMLDSVFELFTQIPSPSQRPPEGLGIGLALARKLVDLHGGTIEAHSDGLGHGSEFIVCLPLAKAGVSIPKA